MKASTQSRCANETKLLQIIGYNAFITMSNEKMAKSQGNILKIKDLEKISGQVIRLALIRLIINNH